MSGSTRSYEFAKRLVKRGDTVYMLTSNWQGLSNLSYSKVEGIHVYWAPVQYSNKISYFKRIFIFSKFLYYIFSLGLKLDYDLIIASSTPLTVALPALLLKRIKDVKMIFEIRDLWPQLPIAMGVIKSKILIKLLKWLEKTTYNKSNHIICLSEGMKTELIPDNPIDKISVITNFSDISGFQIQDRKSSLINKIPILAENHIIVYAGAFGRINGVVYLVEIANILKNINPNIYFLLVGDGYEKDEVIYRSKQYGVYDKTLYCLDYLPKKEMPQLLFESTIASSIFNDIPEMVNNSANKFFDGLAAGKPIMINYKGWQAELLEKTGAGFVIHSNDPKLAASKINKIITDKSTLIKMSEASKELAQQFDLETNYKKFEETINQVSVL